MQTAADGDQVAELVGRTPFDLALVDLVFPPTDGVDVLKRVKQLRPSTLVVVFSGHAEVGSVLRAFRSGAFDFLEKPVDADVLLGLASRALEIRKKALGEDHSEYAETLNNLASLYTRMGRYTMAESLLLQSLEIQRIAKARRLYHVLGHSSCVE